MCVSSELSYTEGIVCLLFGTASVPFKQIVFLFIELVTEIIDRFIFDNVINTDNFPVLSRVTNRLLIILSLCAY